MNEEKKNLTGGITIFSNEEFGQVRTTTGENGEVLVCLYDVCKALGMTSAKVAQRLEKDVLSKHPLSTKGGNQTGWFVNEDGFYDVVLESRKPNAKKFRKLVTSEVLPAIRKTGMYAKEGLADPVGDLRQMTATFTEYVRSQQMVNQVLLETLQVLREDVTAKRQSYVRTLPETRNYDKPMFVVEVSIVPAGVRCVTSYLASPSLGYSLRYPLCGGLQVLVVDGPIEAAVVEGLKEAIQSFTRTPKWAKIRTIQI